MKLVLGMALTFLIANSTSAGANDLAGHASVIDAATIETHGQRIRLNAIDVPESEQLCAGVDGRAMCW